MEKHDNWRKHNKKAFNESNTKDLFQLRPLYKLNKSTSATHGISKSISEEVINNTDVEINSGV